MDKAQAVVPPILAAFRLAHMVAYSFLFSAALGVHVLALLMHTAREMAYYTSVHRGATATVRPAKVASMGHATCAQRVQRKVQLAATLAARVLREVIAIKVREDVRLAPLAAQAPKPPNRV